MDADSDRFAKGRIGVFLILRKFRIKMYDIAWSQFTQCHWLTLWLRIRQYLTGAQRHFPQFNAQG